jgi:hypothetical protein
MVPGMTERDRLAADVRRLAWLADATLGPARIGNAAQEPKEKSMPRPALPIGIWRRGLSSARILGQRIRLLQPAPGEALPRRASAPVR